MLLSGPGDLQSSRSIVAAYSPSSVGYRYPAEVPYERLNPLTLSLQGRERRSCLSRESLNTGRLKVAILLVQCPAWRLYGQVIASGTMPLPIVESELLSPQQALTQDLILAGGHANPFDYPTERTYGRAKAGPLTVFAEFEQRLCGTGP